MTYIAITTEPNKVRAVRKRLRQQGHTAYVAAIVTKRIVPKGLKTRRRRRVQVLMPYVLVQTPESPYVQDLWLHSVLSTKGVRGYVEGLIPESDLAETKAEVARIVFELEAAKHKQWLRTGGKAAFKFGSLAGKVGTVQWIMAKSVGLETKLFGSMRVVVVDREALEAA